MLQLHLQKQIQIKIDEYLERMMIQSFIFQCIYKTVDEEQN